MNESSPDHPKQTAQYSKLRPLPALHSRTPLLLDTVVAFLNPVMADFIDSRAELGSEEDSDVGSGNEAPINRRRDRNNDDMIDSSEEEDSDDEEEARRVCSHHATYAKCQHTLDS